MVTNAASVINSFESSFQDKVRIPAELEMLWLKKAVGRYSCEVSKIEYDKAKDEFDRELKQYEIDMLAAFMKQCYMERELSRVNKQVSIVGKDLSIDGNGNQKTAARNELEYAAEQSRMMAANMKDTAWS